MSPRILETGFFSTIGLALALSGCTTGTPPGQAVLSGNAVPAQTRSVERVLVTPDEADEADEANEADEVTEEVTDASLPTACAEGASTCTPPARFAAKLCQRTAPEVAIAMFRKGTPWTRAYLQHDTRAWYTESKLASPQHLTYGEEVLILRERNTGGIQVGGGSYDVYRFNGTCVSIMADEVTLNRPNQTHVASIPWKYLPESVRDELRKDSAIERSFQARRSTCRARSEPECEAAEQLLSEKIAAYVREGSASATAALPKF